VNLKITVSDAEKAKRIVGEEFQIDAAANKNLLNFTIGAELIPEISKTLAKYDIAILSMYSGEKSLEETFLELTSSAGTSIK
jgi:hypothetical protein